MGTTDTARPATAETVNGPRKADRLAGSINRGDNASEELEQANQCIAKKVASALVPGAWRKFLPIHPAADRIPQASLDERRMLAGDLQQHGLKVPVVLVRVGGDKSQLLDGRHRLDLLEGTGTPVVDAAGNLMVPYQVVEVADEAEAERLSISLNAQRRHLNAEQRRELIAKLLKATPEKSNRQIAKIVRASHPHIAKVRGDLEKSGDVETVTTSVDTKGRQQPAKKKGWARARFRAYRPKKRTTMSTSPMPKASLFEQQYLEGLELKWEYASHSVRSAFARKHWEELEYAAKVGGDDTRTAVQRIADRAEARAAQSKKQQLGAATSGAPAPPEIRQIDRADDGLDIPDWLLVKNRVPLEPEGSAS
jgi:ParB-like chromosome segregation protein Spo0J